MIKSKSDLKYYLECDKFALGIPDNRKAPRPFIDRIWKYEIVLRKAEYYRNCIGTYNRIMALVYKLKLELLSDKMTVFIPCNVFGPGLSIAHAAAIVVNANSRVGCNCRIHEGVTIGATNGSANAPIIGDNCFLGSGAKVIGDIRVSDSVCVGAGAVVVKDIDRKEVTVVGVPARIVSDNIDNPNVIKATEFVRRE